MTPEIIAKTAARWWAEQLKAPKFDNGANDHTGALAVLAHEAGPPLNVGQDAAFATALEAALLADFAKYGRFMAVSTDYSPGAVLSAALAAAGIERSATVLPWKTIMSFSDGSIQVRPGYGADWQTLPLIEQETT